MKRSFYVGKDYVFIEHGLYQCRGFDANGRHYNRAFRIKKEAQKFIKAMRDGLNVDHY